MGQERTKTITHADARFLIRTIGELGELPATDPAARKRHLVFSICRYFNAKVGFFIEAIPNPPHQVPRIVAVQEAGQIDDADRRAYQAYFSRKYVSDPLVTRSFEIPEHTIVAPRNRLVSDREWYESAQFDECRRPARIDDCLHARTVLVPGQILGGFGINRALGDSPFSARELSVLHLLTCETPALYPMLRTVPAAATTALPPRLQRVLDRLLRGESEKQVAAHLGISMHTVHGYVKQLHRRFKVTSRAQLLAACLGYKSTKGLIDPVAQD